MAKWFFFIFIASLTFTMNAAAADPRREFVALMYGLVAVNVFALSLLLIWLASYFPSFKHRGFGVVGHASVFLAAGVGFVGIGHLGLAQETCVFPQSRVAAWASGHGACGALSLLSIVFGVFVLWPSVKLLYGITGRSTGMNHKNEP